MTTPFDHTPDRWTVEQQTDDVHGYALMIFVAEFGVAALAFAAIDSRAAAIVSAFAILLAASVQAVLLCLHNFSLNRDMLALRNAVATLAAMHCQATGVSGVERNAFAEADALAGRHFQEAQGAETMRRLTSPTVGLVLHCVVAVAAAYCGLHLRDDASAAVTWVEGLARFW